MPRRLPLLETTVARGAAMSAELAVRAEDARYRPKYAVWEITLRCDLACHHCGSRAGRARPDELSLPEALDLVAQMADLGVREVTLIGGEAYLYPGWLEVVAAIVARGMACTMTSGGRGITLDLARAAKRAGLNGVSISVDGTRTTHDELRGWDGSFQSAMAAFDALREAGLPVAMNTNFNRRNLGELDQLFELALSQKCHGWQVALTVPMGRAADTPELLLDPDDLLVLMPRLTEMSGLAAQSKMRLLPGNNVGYFGPAEARLRAQLGARGSCSAGRTTLGLEANGDIKGCPSLFSREWVAGNIRTHSLRKVWEQTERMRYMRDRTVEDLWGYCRTCYYAEECKAGCTWMAAALFGRPGNNPYCHHRVVELRSRGLRERLVRVEAPSGEAFDHGLWEIQLEPTAADVAQRAEPAHTL
jgi:radical SAM protein with 4Fe4S-binding SPASM domain